MVARFFLLLLLAPFFLFSGVFTASVNKNQVGLGESFALSLTLKDTSAKATPNIESLQHSFLVHSQQQSSNTVIMNGKLSSSVTWKYVLIPKHEGETIIPSISLETAEGVLATEPVVIRAVKGAANRSDGQSGTTDTLISTSISNQKPYKNEPFFYTVRLTSKQPLVNIQMQRLSIDNAIVEIAGDPKTSEKIGNGIPEGVVEFSYVITPLKAGSLKIPSTIVQGAIPIRRTLSSFFNDSLDPTALMQGFEQWKPFALATEEAVLDVQPAISEVNPWLPAKSLTIEEIWDEAQPLQVGEFFTRGFDLRAEGVNASQLPGLNDRLVGTNQFKIYADKPELATDFDDGIVKSSRKELYTLIPQEPGTLTLPAISIAWWDVERKVKVVTTVPSRTLNVLPAAERSGISKTANEVVEVKASKELESPIPAGINPLLYGLIGGLTFLLVGAIIWALWLSRKMNRLLHPEKDVQPIKPKKVEVKIHYVKEKTPKSKNEKLNDLNPT